MISVFDCLFISFISANTSLIMKKWINRSLIPTLFDTELLMPFLYMIRFVTISHIVGTCHLQKMCIRLYNISGWAPSSLLYYCVLRDLIPPYVHLHKIEKVANSKLFLQKESFQCPFRSIFVFVTLGQLVSQRKSNVYGRMNEIFGLSYYVCPLRVFVKRDAVQFSTATTCVLPSIHHRLLLGWKEG